jgi:dihydrofolate reductase
VLRCLVVAMARNRVIGRNNQLPWHLPAELAHFKHVTMGHAVIMGRRTHESIGKALPGRMNLVVSRNPGFQAPGCTIVESLDAAWEAAHGSAQAFVIGGTSLFEATLPVADRIHLTQIEADVQGDTWFPDFERSDWVETEVARHGVDDRHAFPFRILQLDRRVA